MANGIRGLYEVLITEALEARLGDPESPLEVRTETLRAADAADRLAFHLERLIRRALSSVAETERTAVGVELARKLVAHIDLVVAGSPLAGEAPVAIPTESSASVDFRLVPRQTPERVRALVEEHVRKQDFTIVHDRPSDDVRRTHARLVQMAWAEGYAPLRTPIQHPFAQAVLRVVEEGSGDRPLVVPTFGGSLPLERFARHLGKPLVIVPMANSDNNQHAANENLRIQNLWDAIELYATIFVRLGPLWR